MPEEQIEPPSLSFFEQALKASEQVEARINADFSAKAEVYFLQTLFSGMINKAGQRLIDAKSRTDHVSDLDEAIIISCSRLFNDSFSVYVLAKKGLVLQANAIVRSCLEVSAQAIMFLEHAEEAGNWLRGKTFLPRDVRRLSSRAASSRRQYGLLSSLTHPNYEAAKLHVFPIEDASAVALSYGSSYTPKAAGKAVCAVLRIQLSFLASFYDSYSDRLEALGLLWPADVQAQLDASPTTSFTWALFFDGMEHVLEECESYFASYPDDAERISQHARQLLDAMRTEPSETA